MDLSIVDKLTKLVALQKIDSRLDRIRQIRGGLPEEVRDLEDELEGLKTRIYRLKDEVEKAKNEIVNRQTVISDCRDLIKKYDAQLMDVKNNREYEALTKEIELANLEILTCERKIKQFNEQINEKNLKIEEVQKVYDDRSNDLAEKNRELEQLVEETQIEENELLTLSSKASSEIDPRLYRAYQRIRKNMRNGLAVVTMDRDACGGCFAVIPPQRRFEIRQRKKLIVCENCGRILVDERFFYEGEVNESSDEVLVGV
jgi:predicted  nucleic acid-binding Zn-ribbon protein